MNVFSGSLGADLVKLLGAGLLLVVVLAASKRLVDLLPLGRARRETVNRLAPVLGALAIVVFLLFAARVLLGERPHALPVAVGLIAVGLAAASWTALRDLLCGVYVKAGRVCQVGDTVRIDGIQGRIDRMGYAVLYLETNEGEEAIVPYSHVLRNSVRRAPVVEVEALHVFRVQVPSALSVAEAKAIIREAALRSHWSSIVREPQMALLPDRVLEVTVFALSPDRAPEIEALVHKALGGPDARAASRQAGSASTQV